MKTNPRKPRPLKKGDLIYLKNVGFPFNRTDDGHESWEGASCIVLGPNAGAYGDMVSVSPLIPVRASGGDGQPMADCLFFPESCKRENRPWLKKNLKDIVKLRAQLNTLADTIKDHLS